MIDAEILSSSVWSEAPHVRLVWLTLLILCDTDGYVGAAIPGIARAAGVSLAETRDAMERLQQPDPDSRTKTDEGRRVRLAERGFQILNFREHLDRLSAERAKSRDRVRRFRERQRSNVTHPDGNVTVPVENRDQGVGSRDQRDEQRVVSVPVVEGGLGGMIEARRQMVAAHPREKGEPIDVYRARIDVLLGIPHE